MTLETPILIFTAACQIAVVLTAAANRHRFKSTMAFYMMTLGVLGAMFGRILAISAQDAHQIMSALGWFSFLIGLWVHLASMNGVAE